MRGSFRVQNEVLQSCLMTQVACIFFNDLKSDFSERPSSCSWLSTYACFLPLISLRKQGDGEVCRSTFTEI